MNHSQTDWKFKEHNLTLLHSDSGYEVSLEDCTSSAKCLDWIAQVAKKTWATPTIIGSLVLALDNLLNLQRNLCGGGIANSERSRPLFDARKWVRENLGSPKPSAAYIQTQQELARARKVDTKDDRKIEREKSERTQAAIKRLRSEFKAAFGFTSDKGKKALKAYEKLWAQQEFVSSVFDHKSFYQRGANLIIVSQPYGLDEERLKEICRNPLIVGRRRYRASYTQTDEWAHYYPGSAGCFFVEMTEI